MSDRIESNGYVLTGARAQYFIERHQRMGKGGRQHWPGKQEQVRGELLSALASSAGVRLIVAWGGRRRKRGQ